LDSLKGRCNLSQVVRLVRRGSAPKRYNADFFVQKNRLAFAAWMGSV
jgi:hypothetical protein